MPGCDDWPSYNSKMINSPKSSCSYYIYYPLVLEGLNKRIFLGILARDPIISLTD